MDRKTYLVEMDRVYKHLDSIDLSHEFDLFNSRPNLGLNVLAEFLRYIEKKYPYKTEHVDGIFNILTIDECAEYLEDKYSCFIINSYEITVYNIIKE